MQPRSEAPISARLAGRNAPKGLLAQTRAQALLGSPLSITITERASLAGPESVSPNRPGPNGVYRLTQPDHRDTRRQPGGIEQRKIEGYVA